MQLLSTYKALYYTARPSLCKEAQHLLEDVLLGHCTVNGTTVVIPGHVWARCFNEILFPLVGIGPTHPSYGSAPHMRLVSATTVYTVYTVYNTPCTTPRTTHRTTHAHTPFYYLFSGDAAVKDRPPQF